MTQFVDADHAGNMMNLPSYTEITIYLCRAPIIWYSKKQNTFESRTVRSKIVTIRTGMELTKGINYKLSIMGFLIDGPTLVFCDNNLVVTRMSVPTFTLEKNNLSICYHAVIESVAAGIHRIVHISGEFNPADLITKLLTAAVKWPHIGRIFY